MKKRRLCSEKKSGTVLNSKQIIVYKRENLINYLNSWWGLSRKGSHNHLYQKFFMGWLLELSSWKASLKLNIFIGFIELSYLYPLKSPIRIASIMK